MVLLLVIQPKQEYGSNRAQPPHGNQLLTQVVVLQISDSSCF